MEKLTYLYEFPSAEIRISVHFPVSVFASQEEAALQASLHIYKYKILNGAMT